MFNVIHGSIRKKLVLLVLLALLPILAVLLFNEVQERNDEIHNVERDTLLYLRSFSEVQRSIADSTRTLLRTVSELSEIQRADPKASRQILSTLLKANPIYTNVILVALDGSVIAMGRGEDTGFTFFDRRQFQQAVSTKEFSYGEFVIGKQSRKPIFPFGMPVLNKAGEVQSVLIIGVNLKLYTKQYDSSHFPDKSFFGMCDHRGTRLFRYPFAEGALIGDSFEGDIFSAARDSGESGLIRAVTSDGLSRIVAFEPMRLTPGEAPYMYMFMGIDADPVMADANRDLFQGAVVGVASLGAALLLAWFIGSRTIAAQLDRLTRMAHNLGKGAPVESSELQYDDGEIGELAQTFDTVSAILRKREDDLHAAKEAAELASMAKDEFLANISHEVRTPLNGVMGMLQLLRETPVSREQDSFLQTAFQSSRSLLRVLNDLLDFIKVGAGKLELLEEVFDLEELVRQSTELFQLQLEEKGIMLLTDVYPPAKGRYYGDAGRIRQIVFNLLGNAIKFTETGVIRIEVYTLPHPETDYKRLFFSIEDTGTGIPDSKVDYVFDAFTQVDGSLSREHQGTGLGLPIVKKLVNLMNGNIVMESEVGVGTTVLFCVQVRECEKDAESCNGGEDAVRAKPLTVLLVEDEKVNQIMASRLIEKMGHSVHLASNGKECLDRLAEVPVDVIMMDIQMPVMDGLEASKIIRTSPEFKHLATVPIVALSAHAAEQSKQLAFRAGVDHYLTKPFEKSELENVLRKVGKGARTAR